MRIAVLGPLEVLTEELAPVPVPGAKERLLLAALAAGAPGVVSADRLAETLWDGEPPPTARKSLQAHLVRLRRSLEPDRPKGSTGRYVVRRGTGYALALPHGDIDALSLGNLAARGRAELSSGHAAEAVGTLAAALDLWRGEPYADWPDASFADGERRRLTEVRAGAAAALLEAQLALGGHSDVIPELERLVADEPLREDWWRLLMLALYRGGRQADAMAAGRRARALLAEELGADPGPGLREMEAAILAQDPALDLAASRAPPSPASPPTRPGTAVVGACPYKGLAAYQVSDAAIFHGRQRLVSSLIGRLVDARLVVVSGPSGAGKSSVARAGVLPALANGALPGSEEWTPLVVTPGRTPVDALAGLTGEVPPAAPVVLVCDQMEELWAPGAEPPERAAFLDAILGLLDDGIVVRCLGVLRGDHLGRLAEHAAFTERLGRALVLVPALTDPELREIVQEPARAVGLSVEPELLDAVVADGLGRPGALPLLSTALVGTWERRRGGLLTLAGYLEAGGVAGALTRSAEEAYAALDGEGQRMARRLLVRLADVDDGGALVRRPVSLAELELDREPGSGRRQVVETFVGRRLLAVDGDRLEVAHEALLTAWPRLVRWLEDDAAGRAVRRHLEPAAREWASRDRPDEELYRGARLAAALDWAAGSDVDVSPVEEQFLAASRRRAGAELDETRDRAHREAAGRRRTLRLAIGLAGALVVALVAAGLAVRSQRSVEREALSAEANRLAALSETVRVIDLSMLLAAQGFRLADTPETRDGLATTLTEHRRAVDVVPISPYAEDGSLGDDGGMFFMIGADADLLTWTVLSGAQPVVAGQLFGEWVNRRALDASPTDPVLVAAGSGRDGPWVRAAHVGQAERVLVSGDQVGGDPVELAFTPDGRLVDLVVATPSGAGDRVAWRVAQVDPAAGTQHETGIAGSLPAGGRVFADVSDDAESAIVWTDAATVPPVFVNLATGGQTLLRPPEHDGVVLTYRALSSGAAQLWDDGTVILYGPAGGVRQHLDAHRLDVHRGAVRDVVLARDRTWAATVGDGGAVVRWDVDPGTGLWSRPEFLAGHGGDVQEAEFDPVTNRLITVGRGDRLIVWNPETGHSAAPLSTMDDPTRMLRDVCAVAGRDLTRVEWRHYLPGRSWRATCSDL
jgi:DNA-binding SARP family transcriptional activator/WD40 repeat protein